jgi:hypothetical protein
MNKLPIHIAIDSINSFGQELEAPSDDVLLLRQKVDYYYPKVNRDGEVFVGGHQFQDSAALIDCLIKVSSANTIVQLSKSFEFIQGLIYSLSSDEAEELGTDYPDEYLPKLGYNADAEGWKINNQMAGSDDSTVVIKQSELIEKLKAAETYQDTSRTSKLNSSRLVAACPETTVFTTSYPLTEDQAEIISSIFGAIDRIDLRALVARLLPSYLESKRVSFERSNTINEMDNIDLVDVVDADDTLLESIALNINEFAQLPTLKTVMSKEFAGA